jgi:hypothetical protein
MAPATAVNLVNRESVSLSMDQRWPKNGIANAQSTINYAEILFSLQPVQERTCKKLRFDPIGINLNHQYPAKSLPLARVTTRPHPQVPPQLWQ